MNTIESNKESVANFGHYMNSKLNMNNHKEHWKDCSVSYLLSCLQEEVLELETALLDGEKTDIRNECADIANFAMMILENRGEE